MKTPDPEPEFVTFEEFAAHIKGKPWDYIAMLFRQEYDALDYLRQLPWKKALKDPRSDYDQRLGWLLLYIRQGVLPTSLHQPKHQRARQTIEQIHEDLNSRGQWPPIGAL